MASGANLNDILKRTARRRLAALLATELALVVAMLAIGLCLLLLLRVQVLGTLPLFALAIAGILFLAWRIRRRWLSPYETAQELDRRFALPDTISTAWHFEQVPVEGADRLERLAPLIARQRQDAEDAVQRLSLAEAFPYQLTRMHLAALLLCCAALALFGYRYFTTESLDLRDQLASLHIPFISGDDGPPAMTADDELFKPDPEFANSPLADYQPPIDPSRERLDGTINDMPEITGVNVSGEESGLEGEMQASEQASASDMRSQMENDPRRQPGSEAKDGERREGDRKSDQKGESLFDKFKQAVNNMMDKVANRDNPNMEQRGDEKQNQQAKSQGDQQGDGSDDSSDRQGNQRNDNADANENAKQGEGGQNAKQINQQTNASASEKASDAPSSVGAEDGAKDLAAAKQMEAMGKIAEILGQRAEQVKGEVKVEVEAQKEQTLNTELRNIRARHSDTGGELSRDEVPLRLQNYVKEYLKNARQAGAAASAQSRNR